MHILELEDIVSLLRSEVERAGSQAAWSKKTGINRTLLNGVLNRRRPPTSPIIMKALKLRLVFVFKSELAHSKQPTTGFRRPHRPPSSHRLTAVRRTGEIGLPHGRVRPFA
jgi:lambda repressor-like predicted transcriptional regulator